MTITQADLMACKEYMRIDEDVDDSVVLSLVEYAMDYLAVDNFSTLSPTQKLAVKGLALHAYDHRDDDSSANALPLSLRLILNRVKTDREVADAVAAMEATT